MAYFNKGRLVAFKPPETGSLKINKRLTAIKTFHFFLRVRVFRLAQTFVIKWLMFFDNCYVTVQKLVQVKDYTDYEIAYHGLLLSAGIIGCCFKNPKLIAVF